MVTLAAWDNTTARYANDYATKLSRNELLILPVNAEADTVGAAGAKERKYEYEGHIEPILATELQKKLEEKGMNTAIMDGGIQCWDAKYIYMLPRPSQMNPEIKTATGIPNFPAYTSGHSTVSAAGATVLSYIFPNDKTAVENMAIEAAMSRLYGCVHYRFDNDTGLVYGTKVGEFAVARGRADGSP